MRSADYVEPWNRVRTITRVASASSFETKDIPIRIYMSSTATDTPPHPRAVSPVRCVEDEYKIEHGAARLATHFASQTMYALISLSLSLIVAIHATATLQVLAPSGSSTLASSTGPHPSCAPLVTRCAHFRLTRLPSGTLQCTDGFCPPLVPIATGTPKD
jgi:hypothetical protein